MTAGLPGTGIGGAFYLIAALLTPAWEAVRSRRRPRTPGRWRLAFRHVLLAVLVLASIWLAGHLLGLALTTSDVAQSPGASVPSAYAQVIGRRMTMFTLGTLLIVLCAIELLGWLHRVLPRLRQHRAKPVVPPFPGTSPRAARGG